MNIQPIIEKQKALMEHIATEHPEQPGENRFKKRLLALAVEVGECANEWRGFKFWSKDQQPRTHKARKPYIDLDDADFYNPLLEEFVDGLHFVVDIGISKDFKFPEWEFPEGSFLDIDGCFLEVITDIGYLDSFENQDSFEDLYYSFIYLGAALGFTWEEIEQEYNHKNEINHMRQQNGY